MLAFEFFDEAVVVVNAQDRMDNQITTEHHQSRIQREQGHQKMQDVEHPIVLRRCDQDAQNGKGQGKNRDAGAQARESGSLLGENDLEFPDEDVVEGVLFIRVYFYRLADIYRRAWHGGSQLASGLA
jgi:hypothetical protein